MLQPTLTENQEPNDPTTTSLTGFSEETIWPLGQLRLLVTIGDADHSTRAWMNFMIVRSLSPYNGIIGRPKIQEIQEVPSIAHGMLKFLADGEIVTICSTILIPTECATVITSSKEIPKQAEKNLDIFAWKPLDMTGVPRSIAKHRLNIWEGYSPVRQKKRGHAPERAKAIQVEVHKLVEAGIMREVYYHEWLSNPVMVKKHDGSWRMYVDFTDLNKACPQDCYPLPEIDWKVESLCGYPFKCFLDTYKGYHQIQMAESDKEKKAFHTSQGVYCYTKMPFGLKNAGATYQRLVDKAFDSQVGQNIEVYVDDLVIKSHTEAEMLIDIDEMFQKEVATVVEEEGPTWMTPIIEHLKNGTLLDDRKEASKLRIKARQYELLEGVLYRRSFLKSWLSLSEGIKARLGEGNKNWIEELLHVLWAHHTMIKSSHGDTPFSLTYGTEAVILAEIGMPTYRTTVVDAIHNDEELQINLDLLEERRERAAIRKAKAKLKMTKYYNAKVRGVTLRPGDFVYRSNDASHVANGG
ncbi:reverse transcriptase domain-containing protein [Tanacetum coccineum]